MDLVSYCSADETKQLDYSSEQPLNREPSPQTLIEQFLTPQDIGYDRNHGAIPHIRAEKHVVRVDGHVKTPISLSPDQLRSEFPQQQVVCALECGGNRRHTMRTMMREVEGIDWGDAAVMNCKFKGPRIRDVLLRAGLGDDILDPSRETHVAFACYQVGCQQDHWFGSSVKLEKCMQEDGDAILALEINDQPLTANHGYPVRVVLPGITGARWVKWLDRITVQDTESPNFYQQRDYKILPPDVTDHASAEKKFEDIPPMYDTPINSIVAVPADGETVPLPRSGMIETKGYAVPQGADGPVVRVEVSGDGGKTWVEAELSGASHGMKWCWVLWKAQLKMTPGSGKKILSRATDAGGNTQREHSQWNLRGMAYSGYGRTENLTIVETSHEGK